MLMENWDGQFVLVQPRQERSRSRRRGSRGSRTNGSVGGSTVLSGTEQQALIIDADAEDMSDSEWSGMSDEEGGGGDTTDSMAEEDMPMLDSPALDMIIEEQMTSIMAPGMMGMENGPMPMPPSPTAHLGAPSIVIIDPTGAPSMSEPGLQTPAHPQPHPMINHAPIGPPQTPAPMPMMGTFHSTTDDPAQHAVIDGSKIPTKSPFTHRRKSRRSRADSVSTNNTSNTERKRKSSNVTAAMIQPFADPFFPSTLPKRARYSSIPGHPRYVAAKRQQERERLALLAGDEETSDEAEIDLEDMLETEIMAHESAAGQHHVHGGGAGFRFDRVPVSTYLRRNFGGGAGRRDEHDTFSSPVQARSFMPFGMGMDLGQYASMAGMGLGVGAMDSWGLDDTLAGPPQRMMLVSPGLPALGEGEEGDGALSRKEKRRRKRLGGGAGGMGVGVPSAPMPPLQI